MNTSAYPVSVIIPTYNSWKTLDECIKSIKRQQLKPFEIVVVDNNSSDNTSANIKRKFPEVKLKTLDKNTGVTGGRNAGIKFADKRAKYLLFFDHDMVADRCMVKELMKVAIMDQKIGIVTPKIYYWDDKDRIWAAGTSINLWTGGVVFRGGRDVGQYNKVEEVQIAPAAMLVKKEVVEKIKHFDDRYFATYEDSDFCFRAKQAGFMTYYTPGSVAYHKISPRPEDEADRLLSRAYWVGRNRILFMKSFGNNSLVFTVFLPLFAIYYLYLGIKAGRIKDWFKFVEGTLDGYRS